MIDSQTAVQLGVFPILNASTDVGALANVWQDPPENTQPGEKGLVIIGLVSLAADDSGSLDAATISIFAQSRKPDAAALYAMSSAIRNALEGEVPMFAGADLSPLVFVSADPHLMDDGVTYQDELRFSTFVQPA